MCACVHVCAFVCGGGREKVARLFKSILVSIKYLYVKVEVIFTLCVVHVT